MITDVNIARSVLNTIKASQGRGHLPADMMMELIPFIRIPDKDGILKMSVDDILTEADKLNRPPAGYLSARDSTRYYQLSTKQIECIYRVGFSDGLVHKD